MEPVLALVDKLDLGDEWLEVNHELLFGLAVFKEDDSHKEDETIGRRLLV